MKIKIKMTAGKDYRHSCRVRGRINHGLFNTEWYRTLQGLGGKTIEVETDYLFTDQFNTAPIPGISESGLRIMEESVEEVIDDERPGKGRCRWCGETVSMEDVKEERCPECEEKGYVENLTRP